MGKKTDGRAIAEVYTGCAIIDDPTRGTLLLERNESEPQIQVPEPRSTERMHWGMFLQNKTYLISMVAGEYPYTEVYEYLLKKDKQQHLLNTFVRGLDVDAPASLRIECIKIIDRQLAEQEEYRTLLRSRLTVSPLPDEADFSLVPESGPYADLIHELQEGKRELGVIKRAWTYLLEESDEATRKSFADVHFLLQCEGGYAALFDTLRSHNLNLYTQWREVFHATAFLLEGVQEDMLELGGIIRLAFIYSIDSLVYKEES